MSASQLRWSVIGTWIAVASIAFIAIGSTSPRSWSLLAAFATIPPAMLLWLWNEDRPQLLGSLNRRG